MKKNLLAFVTLAALSIANVAMANTMVVFSDNFSVSQGSSFTTSGVIGTSPWSVSRSGDDYGARIDNGILELTNDASAAANPAGWVFASINTTSFGSPYNPTLSSNADVVTWTLNMRQIRTNPSGFNPTLYGVAFVIGSTSTNIATAGDGYALVLGDSTAGDAIRFVSFTGGLQSLGNSNSGLIVAGAPLNDVGNEYTSLQLTYNPSTNDWHLYGRDDGASGFTDPLTGTLSLLGTVNNSTYVGTPLNFAGAYWQANTVANQTAFFDNITISTIVIPEPSTWALLGVGAFVALAARRRRAWLAKL